MVSTPGRGYLLELLLTKAMFVSGNTIQIIGLSATLPNIKEFSGWLSADVFEQSFRPVPLVEYYKVGKCVYDRDDNKLRELEGSREREKRDVDLLVDLCLEVIPASSVLIFCPTKQGCQSTAEMLASLFSDEIKNHRSSEKTLFLEKLRASSLAKRIDSSLEKVVPYGIAFHHSGLTKQ